MPFKHCFVTFFFFLALTSAPGLTAQVSKDVIASERAKAMAFASQNRYLDAYPILDKIAPALPNDAEVWAHYGLALMARSVTVNDPIQRKFERRRAYEALQKAKRLGTEDVRALNHLDQLPPDGGDDDNFSAANPEVEKALREGEQYFGRGEYDRAFATYEKAHKLDPNNYEAILFMGDSLYAHGKYALSEPWFAKAAAIAPNREQAYRFWGDALLAQRKFKEAAAKFIEAFIAAPYSRHSWDNLDRLAKDLGKPFDIKRIFPPGTSDFGGINIDPAQLSEKDGTKFWLKYAETHDSWRREIFKRQNPRAPTYRRSLKEEVAALTAVAEAAKLAIKNGSLKEPHHSIVNLIAFHEQGALEPYVLFFLADEDVSEDYDGYREVNRDKLRRFLSERVFVF